MRQYRILAAAAIALSVLCACNKDEEEYIGQYLSGTLNFDMPEFVENGDIVTIEPWGVRHPEVSKKGGTYPDSLGYYVINPLTGAKDTIKVFPGESDNPSAVVKQKATYKFKISKDTKTQHDTLGTFTVTAYAYAPGYYGSSRSNTFTIVRAGYGDGCSLNGFFVGIGDQKVPYKGRTFYARDINGTLWFRENLSSTESGKPYGGFEATDKIFGRYYTWEEARTACPPGWELPSSADWDAVSAVYPNVRDLMGKIKFNSPTDLMWTYWAEVGSITDNSGLSIIPTGYCAVSGKGDSFHNLYSGAYFWTSDEDAADSRFGVIRYIDETTNVLHKGTADKEYFAASVRCINKTTK